MYQQPPYQIKDHDAEMVVMVYGAEMVVLIEFATSVMIVCSKCVLYDSEDCLQHIRFAALLNLCRIYVFSSLPRW